MGRFVKWLPNNALILSRKGGQFWYERAAPVSGHFADILLFIYAIPGGEPSRRLVDL